jgi:hypothetical protein
MKQYATQSTLFGFILWSFWLMPTPISAQLVLENTYPTTDLRRINLPVSGEKWYYADDSARQIKLFNADHSVWKTVNYPTEINKKVSLDAMNMPVSETTFNRDSLLEFVWRFTNSSEDSSRVKIINERNDSVSYFLTGRNYLTVNELKESPTKLFVENRATKNFKNKTLVFSLPNMILDTTYDDASDMRRQRFSYAGEKYYFKRIKPWNTIEIRDSNWHTGRSVNMGIFANVLNTPDPMFFVDDKLFNDDSSVEFMFSYHQGTGDSVSKICAVPGISIVPDFEFANSRSRFSIDRKLGQPNNLIFTYKKSATSAILYHIYKLPNVVFETTYTAFVGRRLFKNLGAMYVTALHGLISLHDNTHQLKRTFFVRPSDGYNCFDSIPIVCDSVVNRDTTLEIIWTERTKTQPYEYQLRITTENGANLATIPNARFYALSQMDKLETKLITKTWNGTQYTDTKVWRFTTQTPVNEPSGLTDLDVQISPNPFTTTITINNINAEGPLSIKLFDAVGRLILSEKMTTKNATLTPPNAIPSGIYFLELTDGKRRIVKRLIKI